MRHHCSEPYCSHHDADGECVYLDHIVWCPGDDGEHDEHGDCARTWAVTIDDCTAFYHVRVTGALDAATYLTVEAELFNSNYDNVFSLLPQLQQALAAAAELMRQDREFRDSRVPEPV